MICHTCKHRATKTHHGFLIFGCRKLKYTFGLEKDFISGKWNGSKEQKEAAKVTDMPKRCKDYEKEMK
jgi:hypothetical protein